MTPDQVRQIHERLDVLARGVYLLRMLLWKRAWADGKHQHAPPPPSAPIPFARTSPTADSSRPQGTPNAHQRDPNETAAEIPVTSAAAP